MNIREAADKYFDGIWPIFHEIVSAAETYAYPQETNKAQALDIWGKTTRKTYTFEENGNIPGIYYLKTNQAGPGSHVCNCGYMVSSKARGRGLATAMCEYGQEVAQGVEIYVAPTYDSGDEWMGTMQHIAREGRCWVICSGVALTNSDIPADFPDRETLYPATEEWINPGDSAVVAPGGEIVAGSMRKEKGILYADVDSRRVGLSKRDLDITGHYSRPDIFTLSVNTQPQSPVRFKGIKCGRFARARR